MPVKITRYGLAAGWQVFYRKIYGCFTEKAACPATIKNLNIRSNRSMQSVQNQIRLLRKDQADQGLHCLQFHLYLFEALVHTKTKTVAFIGQQRKMF